VTIGSSIGSYTALPANPVAQDSSSGSGTGAEFTVLWGLLSATVSAKGSGYTSASQLVITGGGGSGGGAADLVLDSATSVELINQPNSGDIVFLNNAFFVASYNGQ
jgi:hypothetical protein